MLSLRGCRSACRHVFRLRGVLVSAAAAVRIPTEFTLGENLDAELPVAV
jgi:hypothetical protein